MLRWLTAGESHGPSLVAILEGLPAHVQVTTDDLRDALAPPPARPRPRRADEVRAGRGDASSAASATARRMGGPVAIEIGNTEWPKWEQVMSADPVDPAVLESLARNAALTRPRPGHADLVGMQKYGFDEARPVLERASARETAARVALGRVASNFLRAGRRARVVSHVVELGGVPAPAGLVPGPDDVPAWTPTRCAASTPTPASRWWPRSTRPTEDGDTLGGVVEVVGPRAAAGPRLARALGPPARRAARRGTDGHPGHQGRRGRRRVRARGHPRLAGARRDRAHRRGHPAHQRPLRRHRGRHVHRRDAPGARRDEADLHRAAGAAHRRRGDRRGGRGPPPALRRLRRARGRGRRRGDGRAGAGRRGAGEVRWRRGAARPAATSRATWTR